MNVQTKISIDDIAAKLEYAAHTLAGFRLFVNSREKAKQPEGRDLYEACLSNLSEVTESLAALQSENARLRAELERAEGDADDRQRLDFIQREYIRVDSFDIPTGAGDADVGWRLTDFYMAEPHERIVAEVFRDDLRAAIDAARGKGS